MNQPPPQGAPQRMLPGWVLLAGAALAACVATILPGLALLLEGFDRAHPDLRALLAEIFVGGVASVFGAVHMRARCLRRGQVVSGLLVAANVGLVGLLGLAFDIELSAGSTVSGPAFLIGLVVVAAVLVANGLVVVASWWLLGALAKRITADPSGARLHAAKWLLGVATAHVVLKGVSGGPVVFGLLAALVAAGLLLGGAGSESRGGLLGGAALAVLLALGATATWRARDMRREAIADIPRCVESTYPTRRGNGFLPTDVLARAARLVPGVADAASDAITLPNRSVQVTVYVLPSKGGPLTPALVTAVEGAIANIKCTETADGARPTVVVQAARIVPFSVHVRAVVKPDADESRVRAGVDRALHAAFDLGAPPGPSGLPRTPITNHVRSGQFEVPPADPAVVYLQIHVGDAWLEAYLQNLPPGSVPVVERIDTEVGLPTPAPAAP